VDHLPHRRRLHHPHLRPHHHHHLLLLLLRCLRCWCRRCCSLSNLMAFFIPLFLLLDFRQDSEDFWAWSSGLYPVSFRFFPKGQKRGFLSFSFFSLPVTRFFNLLRVLERGERWIRKEMSDEESLFSFFHLFFFFFFSSFPPIVFFN